MIRVVAALAAALAWSSVVAAPLDAFWKAVEIDDVRAATRLVEKEGLDPNAVDARGDTVLIAAVRNDATRVATWLIANRKVDLDATNASKETAMMIAAFRNRRDLVEQLLARDAEVNRVGWTALHYAASVGNVALVRLLLEHSAYIDAESPNKTTPLMMAARGAHGDAARALIEEGADPTPINERDLTAADFARRAGDGDLAQWLGARATAWRAKYGTPSTRDPAPAVPR